MNNDEPIKWNKKKQEERTKQSDYDKAKLRSRKIWETFVLKCKQCKRTEDEILQFFKEMSEEMVFWLDSDECKLLMGESYSDYREFTLDLLNEKAASLAVGGVTDKNTIEEYRPDMGQAPTAPEPEFFLKDIKLSRSRARRMEFKTVKQLRKIPFVEAFTVREGFVGMVREGLLLFALFEDGETLPVGKCANLIAIGEGIPTASQFAKMMAKLPRKDKDDDSRAV